MDWIAEISRRRALLIAPVAFGGLLALSSRKTPRMSNESSTEVEILEFDASGGEIGPRRVNRLVLSDAEWKQKLTAQQFYVTRKGSTDSPFTGTYYKSHAPGLYRCIGCQTPLFHSEDKFDSGTGWPSFTQPVTPTNIAAHADTSLPYTATPRARKSTSSLS